MDVDKSLESLLHEVQRERAHDIEREAEERFKEQQEQTAQNVDADRVSGEPRKEEDKLGRWLVNGIYTIVVMLTGYGSLIWFPFLKNGLGGLISGAPANLIISAIALLLGMISIKDRTFPLKRFISHKLTVLLLLSVVYIGIFVPTYPIAILPLSKFPEFAFLGALILSSSILVIEVIWALLHQLQPLKKVEGIATRVKVAAINAASFREPKWPHVSVMVLASLTYLVVGAIDYALANSSLDTVDLSAQSLVLVAFPLVFLILSHSVLLWYSSTLGLAYALGLSDSLMTIQFGAALVSCSAAAIFATCNINRIQPRRILSQGFRNLIAIWVIAAFSVFFLQLSGDPFANRGSALFLIFPVVTTLIVGWAGGFGALVAGWLKKASWIYLLGIILSISILGFTPLDDNVKTLVMMSLIFMLSLAASFQSHWIHFLRGTKKAE